MGQTDKHLLNKQTKFTTIELQKTQQLILSKIYKNDELFVPIDIIRVILELYGYFEMCYQSMFYLYHMTYVVDFGFYYSPILKQIEKQHILRHYWNVYSHWNKRNNYLSGNHHKQEAQKSFASLEKNIADHDQDNLLSYEKNL